ncbi:MAG: hypothetical protein ACI4OJ_11585 [Lachnospiraceae bacterium]
MKTLAEALGLNSQTGTVAVTGSGGRKALIRALSGIPGLVIRDETAEDALSAAAHAPGELPALEGADRVLLLVNAAGFGKPVQGAVRHPDLFCQATGLTPSDPLTPEALSDLLFAEDIPADTLLINGVTDDKTRGSALALAELLHESFPMVRLFACDLAQDPAHFELI